MPFRHLWRPAPGHSSRSGRHNRHLPLEASFFDLFCHLSYTDRDERLLGAWATLPSRRSNSISGPRRTKFSVWAWVICWPLLLANGCQGLTQFTRFDFSLASTQLSHPNASLARPHPRPAFKNRQETALPPHDSPHHHPLFLSTSSTFTQSTSS